MLYLLVTGTHVCLTVGPVLSNVTHSGITLLYLPATGCVPIALQTSHPKGLPGQLGIYVMSAFGGRFLGAFLPLLFSATLNLHLLLKNDSTQLILQLQSSKNIQVNSASHPSRQRMPNTQPFKGKVTAE